MEMRHVKGPLTDRAKRRATGEKADLLRQMEELQARHELRERELNGIGERMAADIKAKVISKERAIDIYDGMMRERGLPEVQRKEKLNQHFGVPLPPLLRSRK